jgi:hypothetical protein
VEIRHLVEFNCFSSDFNSKVSRWLQLTVGFIKARGLLTPADTPSRPGSESELAISETLLWNEIVLQGVEAA